MTTYQEIKKKNHQKLMIGIVFSIIATLSVTISILKVFYSFNGNNSLAQIMVRPIKNFAYFVYQHTSFLKYFWTYSPLPNTNDIVTLDNFYFLITFGLMCTGSMMIRSSRKSLSRLSEIKKQNEDEMIRISMNS